MTSTYSPVFVEYEEKRAQLKAWCRLHYIREFNLQPGTLLDLGCGNGFWSGLFAEEGFTVTGVDIEPDYIFEGRLKHPDVRFERADARDPLGLGLFDVVFIRAISAFYAPTLDDAELVIRNGLRHVNGAMLLSFYTDGSGEDRPGLVSGTLRHHSIKAYEDLVGQAGGHVIRTTQVGRYFQVLAS